MSVFERFGIKPIVNAAGTKTRLGGVRLHPDVIAAMAEAASASVDMAALQAAASREIARITGAEAGYVTSGAAACLTLSAAAAMTGTNPAAIDRLPETAGLRERIVIFRSHRNSYDHAWRAAGATLVEVGLDDQRAGSGVRTLDPWELEAAIDDATAAVAYVATRRDDPPLELVADIAHARGVPVLVDAAAQLPPVENLRRFVEHGADLVAFSGGKAIGGPQGSGLLCGRRDLVEAVALNHLDLDVHRDLWAPPPDLIRVDALPGFPRHGIGRGFKVGPEQVIGLLVALRRFVEAPQGPVDDECEAFARSLVALIDTVEGLQASEVRTAGALRVEIRLPTPGHAADLVRVLERGDPPIAIDPFDLGGGLVAVDPTGLDAAEGELVVARIAQALHDL